MVNPLIRSLRLVSGSHFFSRTRFSSCSIERMKFNRRLIIRVLRNQFPLNGEGEDSFTEISGGDRVGLVEEKFDVRRSGRVGKAGDGGAGKCGLLRFPFPLLRLQPITQRHQLIHLRHDPFLFGEGRKGNWEVVASCSIKSAGLIHLPHIHRAEVARKQRVDDICRTCAEGEDQTTNMQRPRSSPRLPSFARSNYSALP